MDKELAYEVNGSVYFRVSKHGKYGNLACLDTSGMEVSCLISSVFFTPRVERPSRACATSRVAAVAAPCRPRAAPPRTLVKRGGRRGGVKPLL